MTNFTYENFSNYFWYQFVVVYTVYQRWVFRRQLLVREAKNISLLSVDENRFWEITNLTLYSSWSWKYMAKMMYSKKMLVYSLCCLREKPLLLKHEMILWGKIRKYGDYKLSPIWIWLCLSPYLVSLSRQRCPNK